MEKENIEIKIIIFEIISWKFKNWWIKKISS